MAFWEKITDIGNIEDRRGAIMGIGITGIALAIGAGILSGNSAEEIFNRALNMIPASSIEQIVQSVTSGEFPVNEYAGKDEYELFASRVLGSGNAAWERTFKDQGKIYSGPTLVLFRTATATGCGLADSRIGPFYCPVDQKIYLDETFFDDLTAYYGAKGGDVAQAYVIAHELGHHVQYLMGSLDNQSNSNEDSIKIELQADCYAGIWANSLADKNVFEKNEITEAMDAAAAVGDDRIQQKIEGRITPENWTHGSSAQRVEWFTRGWEQGTMEACAI